MLVDMRLQPQPKAEEKTLLSAEADHPEYPYGLCITLDDESLTKLGMSELPMSTPSSLWKRLLASLESAETIPTTSARRAARWNSR